MMDEKFSDIEIDEETNLDKLKKKVIKRRETMINIKIEKS